MALEYDEGNGSEPERQRTPEQTQRRPSSGGNLSARERFLAQNRPFGRANSNEVLGKALKVFQELFNSDFIATDSKYQLKDHRLLPLDSSESGGSPAALIVLLEIAHGNTNYVYYHTMILEGSGVLPPPVEDDYRGTRYVEPVVVGDVWKSNGYRQRIERLIKSQVADGSVLVNCDAHVIYKETNFENDAESVRGHTFYATAAIATTSIMALGYEEPLSLAALGDGDALEVSISYDNPQPLLSPDGLPRRTDIKVVTDLNLKGLDGEGRQIVPFTIVGGQLEMIYAPRIDGGSGRWNRGNRDDEAPVWRPTIWLNTIDTQTNYVNLETVIIALASVLPLFEGKNWSEFLNPQIQNNPARDVGLLGYHSKLTEYQRLETRGANFSYDDYMNFLSRVSVEEMIIGLEIEECGELSWLHNVFRTIAEDGPDAAPSRASVIAAIDHLTNNNFSRLWDSNDKMVWDDANSVVNGYIREKNGGQAPLSEFDGMYLLDRRGEEDPELALAYQNTFDDDSKPEGYRLAMRRRIQEDVLGNSFVEKYKSRRYGLTTVFLQTIARAIIATGIRFTEIAADYGRDRRTTYGNTRYEERGGIDVGRDLYRTGKRLYDEDRRPRRRDYR